MTTTMTSLEGNSQWLDGGAMFGNVPRAMWEKWVDVDAASRIRLACRALLVEHDGKRVLCETGIGAFFEPKLAERFGVAEKAHVLLESLAALGLTDSSIDFVVLSHLHFDHAGGLLPAYAEIAAGRQDLLFPKALYLVGKEAYERAKKPHVRDRASFVPGLVEKLEASGRLRIVEGATCPDVLPDRLTFRYSHGHTPGQMHAVFRGRERKVMFCGDLIPGTPWVHAPITMGYDRYPEMLIDEKLALYETAVKEHWLFFYTHDTQTAASGVAQDEKGKFVPTDKLPAMTRLPL